MQETLEAGARPTVNVYEGAAASGKTARIIDEAAAFLGVGAPDGKTSPAGVLVLCASSLAAQAFMRRARRRLGDAAASLRVTTARELALELLQEQSVASRTGRNARMLSGASFQHLMEDMKTTGLKPKRLQEMLRFFFKSFSELADDDEGWLVSEEERMVHASLQRFLDMRRAYVEPQLSAAALRAVEADGALRRRFGASHVLVDDYQTLSRASQLFACALAHDSLGVSFDAAACVEVFDSYPYAKGLDELVERFPQACVHALKGSGGPSGISSVRQCLHDEACGIDVLATRKEAAAGYGDSKDCQVACAETPLDEFRELAGRVVQLRRDEPSGSIVVAVPNASWASNCMKAFSAAGVPAEAPFTRSRCVAGIGLAGGVNARALALLRLVADPRDALAWRDWLAAGDYMANSAAFDSIARYAEEASMSLPQALDALAAQGAAGRAGAGLEEVLLAYGATKAKLDCMRESACKDCAELLAQAVSFASNGHAGEPDPLLAELCSDGAAQDAAAERPAAELAAAMCAHADALFAAPKQVDEGAVLVAPYSSLAGCEADALFVTGLVNGFFPAYDYFDTTVTMLDKQEGVHRDDARAFYALTACAKSCLRASFFRTMDLEAAEKLRIKVARIYLEGGRRTCRSVPSDFLAAF